MGRIVFILFIVTVFTATVVIASKESRAMESSVQTATVLEGVSTMSGDFNETGTLVFYPNNVGPVPYLFYQDQKGNTVAKALVFPDSSPTDFSSWTGSRISITGIQVMEHVVVSSATYVSGP